MKWTASVRERLDGDQIVGRFLNPAIDCLLAYFCANGGNLGYIFVSGAGFKGSLLRPSASQGRQGSGFKGSGFKGSRVHRSGLQNHGLPRNRIRDNSIEDENESVAWL
jgi:hypothetical protein